MCLPQHSPWLEVGKPNMRERHRILTAEDNPFDAFLLKRAFLKAGVNVPMDMVTDGQEVIDYLNGEEPFADRKKHPLPSVLVLDLKMPRISGFDVIEWIRRQPGLRRLPILVLTSSNLSRDVNRAYELGANSYLVKPSELQDLEQVAAQVERYWLALNQCPDCEQP